MKENRPAIAHWALYAAAVLSGLAGACVEPVKTVQVPGPDPLNADHPLAAALPPPPATTDWQDAPATAGNWRWSREGSFSIARFVGPGGAALLSLTCNPQAGTITLSRKGAPDAPPSSLSVRTTSLSRTLTIQPGGDAAVILPARDPLLDAIAFSRGRFAVAVPAMEGLYLPSWPEVGRVIEDCRQPANISASAG